MPIVFADGDQDYLEKLNDLADAYESAADIVETVNDHIAGTADKHAASAIVNTPAGNIAATTVQAAINELDTEKARLDGAAFSGAVSAPGFTGPLTGNVTGNVSGSAGSVAAANLTGTTLAANAVNASLNSITPTGGLLAVTGSQSITGNLGIGYSTFSNAAGASGRKFIVGDAATSVTPAAITVYSGAATYGGVYFADGWTGDQAYRGYVEYNHATDTLSASAAGGAGGWSLSASGFNVTGSISATAGVTFPSYTVGTLPAVSTAGGMIYVSNETGGAVSAFSDGANWRRVTDRAIVS